MLDAELSERSVGLLLSAARRSARPSLAAEHLLILAQTLDLPVRKWHREGRRAVAIALGGSNAIVRYLSARPRIALPLLEGCYLLEAKPLEVMRRELRQRRAYVGGEFAGQIYDLDRMLRRYRVREWVRIVARELSRLDGIERIGHELSDLAEVTVGMACRYHLRRERSQHGPRWEENAAGLRPSGLSVLAQGKLGSRELNVSSDIDVQFLYSSDATPEASPLNLHGRYVKIARDVIRTLSKPTEDGFCFRVDTNLRPEGKQGALANSVPAAERYYESWGQGWERLALIRQSHVGGARWVFESFSEVVRPFVFPRSIGSGFVEEIRSLKNRLHDERRARARSLDSEGSDIDIKRDSGCIREIELFVQILQTLHAGRQPALRIAQLSTALERLHFAGILGTSEAHTLQSAYAFFRRLENTLQAIDEHQTQTLPTTEQELAHLGRLLGKRGEQPGRALLRTLNAQRRHVSRETRSLLGESGKTLSQSKQALYSEGRFRLDALAALGFWNPEQASSELSVLEKRLGGPFSRRASERIKALAEPILEAMVSSPDPDQALRLWFDLNRQLSLLPVYYHVLENPQSRRRVMDLLGSSEFLGRALVRSPELIDWLGSFDSASDIDRHPTIEALEAQVQERMSVTAQEDIEFQFRSLGRFKLHHQLRVGLLDLTGGAEHLAGSGTVVGYCGSLPTRGFGFRFALLRKALAQALGSCSGSAHRDSGDGRSGGARDVLWL